MIVSDWISNNYIEVFGAVTGIIYVFLEIRQTIWLWPVGILTSAVYIWIFFTSKIYADMSLQVYYLAISILGWYWWAKGTRVHRSFSEGGGRKAQGNEQPSNVTLNNTPFRGTGTKKSGIWQNRVGDNRRVGDKAKGNRMNEELHVTRLTLRTGVLLTVVFILLYCFMWLVLTRLTDSPVPVRDSFVTSLSIIATWMLARKIYEHWYLWIVVNFVSAVLFLTRGLYPTVILYLVYGIMSFTGLVAWKKTIPHPPTPSPNGEGV